MVGIARTGRSRENTENAIAAADLVKGQGDRDEQRGIAEASSSSTTTSSDVNSNSDNNDRYNKEDGNTEERHKAHTATVTQPDDEESEVNKQGLEDQEGKVGSKQQSGGSSSSSSSDSSSEDIGGTHNIQNDDTSSKPKDTEEKEVGQQENEVEAFFKKLELEFVYTQLKELKGEVAMSDLMGMALDDLRSLNLPFGECLYIRESLAALANENNNNDNNNTTNNNANKED